MPLLPLVVDRRAALDDLLQLLGVEDLAGLGRAPDLFGQGQHRPAVAIRHAHERGARLLVERQRLCL